MAQGSRFRGGGQGGKLRCVLDLRHGGILKNGPFCSRLRCRRSSNFSRLPGVFVARPIRGLSPQTSSLPLVAVDCLLGRAPGTGCGGMRGVCFAGPCLRGIGSLGLVWRIFVARPVWGTLPANVLASVGRCGLFAGRVHQTGLGMRCPALRTIPP